MRLLRHVNRYVTSRIPIKGLPSRLTRSIASITFDDFPRSSWRVGGTILARYNASATFYVSGALCGQRVSGVDYYDADDLTAVYAAGHEIGSHTFAHHDVRMVADADLVADVSKNERFIQEHLGDCVPETFAYPFCETSLRAKILFSRHFACCRGGEPGVNRGLLDLGQLKVLQLDNRTWQIHLLEQVVAFAAKQPCWMIFLAHDISESPTPFGITPSMLHDVLGKLGNAGIEILTMKNAMARACYR